MKIRHALWEIVTVNSCEPTINFQEERFAVGLMRAVLEAELSTNAATRFKFDPRVIPNPLMFAEAGKNRIVGVDPNEKSIMAGEFFTLITPVTSESEDHTNWLWPPLTESMV